MLRKYVYHPVIISDMPYSRELKIVSREFFIITYPLQYERTFFSGLRSPFLVS